VQQSYNPAKHKCILDRFNYPDRQAATPSNYLDRQLAFPYCKNVVKRERIGYIPRDHSERANRECLFMSTPVLFRRFYVLDRLEPARPTQLKQQIRRASHPYCSIANVDYGPIYLCRKVIFFHPCFPSCMSGRQPNFFSL